MIPKHATLNDAFCSAKDKYPDKTALIFKDQSYTFSDLDKLVQKVAAFLNSKDVIKGEMAVIYLPHMPEWVATWLALQRIGAIAVPVTHFYGHEELAYIVKDCGADTIFCTEKNFEQVVKASAHTPPKRIIIMDGNGQDLTVPSTMQETEVIQIDSIFQGENLPALPSINMEETEIAEILYTGGTTGFPKGVPLTHLLLLTAMNVKRDEFESLVPRGEGISIQGAPLNHILGQELGLGTLLSGDTLILLPKMDLDDLMAHIDKYKVTTFFGTPTLCRMILENENLSNYDFSSLKYVFTGGEALPGEVARQWTGKFNHPIYNGYGSTETCGGITGIPVEDPFPESTSGKVVSTKRVKLINPETLEPSAVNEPGELLVSSENMVTAYWNKPEETAMHFKTIDGQVWYCTGDIVRMDEAGWIFFVDRSVDMIKHKGYRVAAIKVEAVLYKHEAVLECCIIGIPDAKVGEIVKGFVVLKAGMQNTTAEELIQWCSQSLASYETPSVIEFQDSLPKSAVGKILRRLVRNEARGKIKSDKQTG